MLKSQIISCLPGADGMEINLMIPDGEGTYIHQAQVMSAGEDWRCELLTTDEQQGIEIGSYDVPQEAVEVMSINPTIYILVIQVRNPNTGGVDLTYMWN